MDTLPLTQLRAPSGDSTLMSWYKPHRFVMAATDTVLISIVVILTIAFRLGDDVLAPSNAGVAPHIAGGVIIGLFVPERGVSVGPAVGVSAG
ncbi:MAG: hypothetical protein WAS07_05145 [Micropruina sp.]